MTKWKLVPVEPTPEMMRAGMSVPINKAARHNAVYRAMLEASPKPEPLSDADIILISDNMDEGDWNDLRFRKAWRDGFLRGFREAEREILGGGHE